MQESIPCYRHTHTMLTACSNWNVCNPFAFFLVICYRQSPSEFQGSELYKCFPQEKKTLTVQPIEFQTNLRTKDIFLRTFFFIFLSFHLFYLTNWAALFLQLPSSIKLIIYLRFQRLELVPCGVWVVTSVVSQWANVAAGSNITTLRI